MFLFFVCFLGGFLFLFLPVPYTFTIDVFLHLVSIYRCMSESSFRVAIKKKVGAGGKSPCARVMTITVATSGLFFPYHILSF